MFFTENNGNLEMPNRENKRYSSKLIRSICCLLNIKNTFGEVGLPQSGDASGAAFITNLCIYKCPCRQVSGTSYFYPS